MKKIQMAKHIHLQMSTLLAILKWDFFDILSLKSLAFGKVLNLPKDNLFVIIISAQLKTQNLSH